MFAYTSFCLDVIHAQKFFGLKKKARGTKSIIDLILMHFDHGEAFSLWSALVKASGRGLLALTVCFTHQVDPVMQFFLQYSIVFHIILSQNNWFWYILSCEKMQGNTCRNSDRVLILCNLFGNQNIFHISMHVWPWRDKTWESDYCFCPTYL